MNHPDYFCQTIQHLRSYEEILLFSHLLPITDEDQKKAVLFLEREYGEEADGFPDASPLFDAAAALWAGKTLYLASQFLLHREHRVADLPVMFSAYAGEKTPSAILSNDLLLRFLPDVILQLKAIDADDELVPILEATLTDWHYSAIGYPLEPQALDFSFLDASACLRQLYVNRVIASRNLKLAKHPPLRQHIAAALGIYAPQLWSAFHQDVKTEHESH